MRNLLSTYTFVDGSRTIHIPLHEFKGVENIRLIVNETQKKVICSSMQKDNITACVKDANGEWDITYDTTIPALVEGDKLTIEIDLGNSLYLDGEDIILAAKLAGMDGQPFAIGKELGAKLWELVKLPSDIITYLLARTNVTRVDMSSPMPLPDAAAIRLGYLFANCVNLLEADISGYLYPKGPNGSSCIIRYMFSGCYNLKKVILRNKPLISPEAWCFSGVFNGCTSLTDMVVHPYYLGSQISDASFKETLVNLELTDDVQDSISLSGAGLLSSASVLNVLTHLDLTVTGKSVTFYTSGLTVMDDENGSLQAAKDAAVTAGWTINNLTITPYSA